MILVTGGARCGKSSFAEKLSLKYGEKVLYLATAVPFDQEMKERIQKHQNRRPKEWITLEGYINLEKDIIEKSKEVDTILLDCITIMVTNLLFYFAKGTEPEQMDFPLLEQKILAELEQTISALQKTKKQCILVTNEIGMGIVPESVLSRQFRDIAGRVNQKLADISEEVYLVISGIPVKIKGEKR